MPIVVFAATDSEETEVALLQEGEFSLSLEESAEAMQSAPLPVPERDKTQQYIYNKLLSCSTNFSLYSYKVTVDDFRDIYCNVINDNPDLFYVSSSVNYSYYTSSGYISSVHPEYSMSKSAIQSCKEIFDAGVQKALSVVDDSMTDLQKALVLHDYICDLADYPYDAVTNDKTTYHSAYGFFYDHNIVCAGYALTYSYLLHQVGIEAEYVVSTKMMHAWNAVKIDGKWYNADLCFDDLKFYNNSMNVRGGMLHRCFLKSDEYLTSERGFYHYGFTTYDNCDTTNTDLDDYFWDDVNTNIYVIDGDYYYLDISASEKVGRLRRRTLDGVENQLGTQKFSYAAVNVTSAFKDENGEYHDIPVYDPLCRLVYLDNRFYITYGKYIVSYAYINNRYKMYLIYQDSSYNLMGLGVDETGNLVCQRRTDFRMDELDKFEFFNRNITTAGNSAVYNNYVDIDLDGTVNAKDYAHMKCGCTHDSSMS